MTTDQAPKLAKWKDGIVDEPWKRRVVLADRQRAINTINGLGAILFGTGFPGVGVTDFEGQCDVLGKLTGEQIAGTLKDYWRRTQRELEASKQFAVKGEEFKAAVELTEPGRVDVLPLGPAGADGPKLSRPAEPAEPLDFGRMMLLEGS